MHAVYECAVAMSLGRQLATLVAYGSGSKEQRGAGFAKRPPAAVVAAECSTSLDTQQVRGS
jgi:hypothetical protein